MYDVEKGTINLNNKLVAAVKALNILKTQTDESFIDELLVQAGLLKEAYDDELVSLKPERFQEIHKNIAEISAAIYAKKHEWGTKKFEEYRALSFEIYLCSNFAGDLAKMKRNLAKG